MSLPASTFFILGPTAVGKSDLAVEFAERIGGEIVGADAFQIYAGLDTLSAKPSPELRRRVPHHLIGDIPLHTEFDVAQYRALALERIETIAARGKTPIVCGGTGLYVRALTHGLAATPPRDSALRAELERQPLEALAGRLRELDPHHTVDVRNPRRVIRALEVCLLTGKPFSAFRQEWGTAPPARGAILTISRERLLERIATRTHAMFAAGVIAEVAAAGLLSATAAQMIGFREIQEHLAGRLTRDECAARILLATRQYAKRQMTWFRREQGFTWLDLDAETNPVAVLQRLAARKQSSGNWRAPARRTRFPRRRA